MLHRFVIWTDPTGTVDRPGWYVDEVTISNAGETPGSWFHGSLTGEYAPDAHAHLTIPVQLNVSSGISGAWMIRYWTDFDLEGGSWDKFEIQVSSDNISWHRMSPAGGIPGPYGLTVSGQTIMEDTGGWVEVAHPFPSTFTIPNNGSLLLRIVVETDQMPSSGYGGALDPPEGVFIDDVSITQTQNGTTDQLWFENFTTMANGWHDRLPGGTYDQWQHLTNWGNNGPWESTWSFEDAPSIADGWLVHTPHGQSWGLYTPAGYTLDKSLEHSKKFPKMFELLETYSGHGNAEEYRSWRGVDVVRNGQQESRPFTFTMGDIDLNQGTFTIENPDGSEEVIDIGTQTCPDPSDNYIPQCWQAGKIIYERCIEEGTDERSRLSCQVEMSDSLDGIVVEVAPF